MRRFLLALVSFTFAPCLHAQLVEIYGSLSEIHTNNVPVTIYPPCPVNAPSCGPLQTGNSTDSFMAGGGITLNVIRAPFVKLGIDLRGAKHAGSSGSDTAMGGIKLSLKPPIFHIAPYIQGSVGYLGTTATRSGQTQSEQYGAAEVLAGVDVPLAPFFNLRLIEVGVGHAITSANGSKPTFATAGAGLVFHF